jgi:archaemetzincin
MEHRAVRDALVARYGIEVRILPAHAAPRAAWYAPRRRHRAEVLLDFLDERLPPDGAKILGLSHTDISTSKPPHADWGILGLANIAGRSAVVSSFRCRRRARSATHALERLAKVAVHEVGHALGLPHCTDAPDCLMRDAGGSVLSLDGESDLCRACRARLAARGWML